MSIYIDNRYFWNITERWIRYDIALKLAECEVAISCSWRFFYALFSLVKGKKCRHFVLLWFSYFVMFGQCLNKVLRRLYADSELHAFSNFSNLIVTLLNILSLLLFCLSLYCFNKYNNWSMLCYGISTSFGKLWNKYLMKNIVCLLDIWVFI